MQPGSPGPDRRRRGPDVPAHRGRRLLRVHAALPLQRPDDRLGPGPGGGATLALARALQRLPVPSRYPDASEPPTSTTWASRLSYILATPEQPDDADNPCAGCSGTRRPRPMWPGSPNGSAARCRTPTAPPKAGPRSPHAGHPSGGLGPGPAGDRDPRPRYRRGVPRAVLRRTRPAAERRRGHRGDGQPDRRGRDSRGTGTTPRPTPARVRNGWYWTGDLAYRDDDDFFYFGGRDSTGCGSTGRTSPPPRSKSCSSGTPMWCWPRSTPCPTPSVGDQVMATLLLHEGGAFDPEGFARFWPASRTWGPSGRPASSGSTTSYRSPPPPRC